MTYNAMGCELLVSLLRDAQTPSSVRKTINSLWRPTPAYNTFQLYTLKCPSQKNLNVLTNHLAMSNHRARKPSSESIFVQERSVQKMA